MDAAGSQVADEYARYGMLKHTIFLINLFFFVVILSENLKLLYDSLL